MSRSDVGRLPLLCLLVLCVAGWRGYIVRQVGCALEPCIDQEAGLCDGGGHVEGCHSHRLRVRYPAMRFGRCGRRFVGATDLFFRRELGISQDWIDFMFCIDPRMPFAATATIVMVLALTACSGKDDKTKSATQVAAKVNGGEISVHQINDVLARAGNVPADQARQASGKVLEGLIGHQAPVVVSTR